MDQRDPINKSKNEFGSIISKISSDTAVGIDPQLTHAIIIEYLMRIDERLRNLEKQNLIKK